MHATRPGATLAEHTTLRLGGPAHRVVTVIDPADLPDAVPAGEPVLLLAGGSNVVIADEGFPGTAVLLRTRGVSAVPDGDTVAVTVAAGEPWDEVVAATVAAGWAGLECLSGIPGSAGATPIQNVGAYGQEVARLIDSVLVYDRATGVTGAWPPSACGFGYRTSAFKHDPGRVVVAVTFRLRRSGRSGPIRYPELARALGVSPGCHAPLADVRDAVLGLRAGKGMVLDAADPDTCSVGSFFTNPVLPEPAFTLVRERAGEDLPAWPCGDGMVKTSAAALIERAGFGRGYARGAVAVSGKHTLALTNRGGASTAELLDLAREIRDGVRTRFAVELRPEPVLVNCSL